ncbi:MAG: copper chaperone PCu(A)C [Pseudomonadota bacterium]
MKYSVRIALSALAALLLAGPSFANETEHDHAAKHGSHEGVHKLGSLTIDTPWTRATVKTAKVAAGYLTISNSGDAADRLLSVSTPVAGRGEVHEMKVVDNVMSMLPLPEGIEIPAGGSVDLQPGGLHLMFLDLNTQLNEGGVIEATLTFEKAGTITIPLAIKGLAAKSGHGDHSGHGAGHSH